MNHNNYFENSIEYVKGIGPQRADILKKELKIFTIADLIQHYPFRHEDRSQFHKVSEIRADMPYIQVKGKIKFTETLGEGSKQRFIAYLRDETGDLELVWFKGIVGIKKFIQINQEYIAFGKPNEFNGKITLPHPEIQIYNSQEIKEQGTLFPVYHTTEKMKQKGLDSKAFSKIIRGVLPEAIRHIRETLPEEVLQQHQLISKKEAIANIHFPKSIELLKKAEYRLKFEELFYTQLRLIRQNLYRKEYYQGFICKDTSLVTEFYKNHLEFDLTDAQKRVIREIYKDVTSGKQMNRLLQGDVGSGKTVVAFIAMLLAVGNGFQACLMAPTEILAEQHYQGLKKYADKLNIPIDILTGSSTGGNRKLIHDYLQSGDMKILIGTHALIEEKVKFKNLGLAIIDEQHRFGVEQRSKLWHKNQAVFPHVLVMTATPIPRTLAMTLYGDLDVSIIDELPPGRKPVRTVHRYDAHRFKVFGFIREEIRKGRQAYFVYPLIEESEKLDLKNLMDGYESIKRAFPEYAISIVHGQMKPKEKDYEMQRFARGETQIMVATTVIEVGVNVPNASIMVIENAERFGLSQLHQLRGRVGRGSEQSYCILMTKYELSKEARERIKIMVETNDGFEIANTDLRLRGPGDLMGTQQSGILDLLIADLAKDAPILEKARQTAFAILQEDTELKLYKNACIKHQLESLKKSSTNWARIS